MSQRANRATGASKNGSRGPQSDFQVSLRRRWRLRTSSLRRSSGNEHAPGWPASGEKTNSNTIDYQRYIPKKSGGDARMQQAPGDASLSWPTGDAKVDLSQRQRSRGIDCCTMGRKRQTCLARLRHSLRWIAEVRRSAEMTITMKKAGRTRPFLLQASVLRAPNAFKQPECCWLACPSGLA